VQLEVELPILLRRVAVRRWANRDTKPIDHETSIHHETLLAEFAALRAEILQRQNIQWNTFALQLTAAGVVFSFALSNASHTGFLLILPVVTYALTGRYVSQSIGTEKVGIYIREVLNVKLKGQLHWEEWHKTKEWNRSRPTTARVLTWINPLYLAFPGVAVIALAWVAPYVWTSHNVSTGKRVLVVVIWLIGVAITALSFQLISHIVSKFRRRPAKPNA
jgi:hypothetical protein